MINRTGKVIMTFDVISVNRRELKLTGDSKRIFVIYSPNKQMQNTAKKTNVVAVEIENCEEKKSGIIVVDAIKVMTLKEVEL